jgi:hypothetical protein
LRCGQIDRNKRPEARLDVGQEKREPVETDEASTRRMGARRARLDFRKLRH